MNERLSQLALDAAKGNRAAADYVLSLVEVLHFWDDLIDKDCAVSDRTIHRMFMHMLVEMPRNPFFLAHQQNLTPVLIMAIQNWHVANAVERGECLDIPMECAFIIRSAYTDIITLVATICGGYEHGVEVGKAVRALAHEEGFDVYQENLAAEKLLRDARE
jgi:hypothetical protein